MRSGGCREPGRPGSGRSPHPVPARVLLEGTGLAVPLAELLASRRLVLDSWVHERTFDRPGAGATALYRVRAIDREGGPLTLYAGATTYGAAAAGPVLRTSLSGVRLFLWLHPSDPLLPDLAWALSPPDIARQIFGAADVGGLDLTVIGYRPLRRAVVHAVQGGDEAYVKVVLPAHAEGLRHRHRLLAESPVPAAALLAGTEGRSAVALSPLPGRPLLHALADGSSPLTSADLIRILDALPAAALELRRRPAWAERARAYGRAAADVLAAGRRRIFGISSRIEAMVEGLDPGPVVPVHGDFYEGNLLTADGRITGVLDVDGLGPGHRIDDLACFLGHLAVLARLSPESALPDGLAEYGAGFESAAEEAGSSAAALNARAAGVALSLVPGARDGRGLDRQSNAALRLAAAEGLLELAERSPGA
ncbi:aminoglycoside phosphotransferase family protein [Arthrobacter gandavensis]|uniref:aminoglycoside phosphotransferase family protein n=1 Tax=Arthrobacter gandavensis TaxID=169960 RepID=UPI00188E73BB|nr:aminoglycoside phosphotransferase family protein [Arthrobacter gandavensis]MBF4993799.1 aminoglycoside phosphotransferase family protein [Arthrobacter gandavensis]